MAHTDHHMHRRGNHGAPARSRDRRIERRRERLAVRRQLRAAAA